MKKHFFEHTIRNESGNILIRNCFEGDHEVKEGLIVAESIHLWDKNLAGCVVIFWTLVKSDDNWAVEAREVGDRLTSTQFDDGVMQQMFLWGRKISNIILDFYIV